MQPEADPIVVISWWSNCLGLSCVQSLLSHAGRRCVFVVQVGKSETQKARFRQFLPPGVRELFYPETAPGEHARVLANIVLEQLPSEPGLWLVDHDVTFQEPIDGWLQAVETWSRESGVCLCLAASAFSRAITSPVFWISPARWPHSMRSFDPVPFHASESSRRPDLFRCDGEMRMPVADTLVQQRDALAIDSRVGSFPVRAADSSTRALPPLPAHTHPGGLSLFAGPMLPAESALWMKSTASRFADFFAACPPEWNAIEDAVLLQRCQEFLEACRE